MTSTQGGNMLDGSKAVRRKKKGSKRWSTFPLRGVAILLLLAGVTTVGAYGYAATSLGDHIANGVHIAALDMSGRTREEAEKILHERVMKSSLTFITSIGTTTLAPDGDSSTDSAFAAFNINDSVAQAYAVGRAGDASASAVNLLRAALFGKNISVPVSVNEAALRKQLELRFGGKARPAQDAQLVIKIDSVNGAPEVTVTPGVDGWEIDYDGAAREAESQLRELADTPITISVKKDLPNLTEEDVRALAPDVAHIVARAPFTLSVGETSWTVSKNLLASWIIAAPSMNGKAVLILDTEKVKNYLSARGATLAAEPTDAIFEEKNGRVIKFVPAAPGETLNLDASLALIEKTVLESKDTKIALELPKKEVQPNITTEATNSYGIKEIIGVGATNFRGSPVNRRHNIGVGAASVHGTLIPPDTEFSMLKTLGTIDGTTGYLQELVIKLNRTTPEYGGGLCQIGSTAFRAALASGLPITVRQNHSYRVPYYERDGDGNDIGPGKDATIYDPAPDFRFLNDTGHYILIMTAIEKNKLSFTFWGTKDGRVAMQTKAKVFNIVPPPEKKVVPTTDLKPGEEKCTEHAHMGSDAVFTYTVTFPDGSVKTKDFKSHYKPWQEVCLEGVEPSQMPPPVPDPVVPPVGSADAAGAAGTIN